MISTISNWPFVIYESATLNFHVSSVRTIYELFVFFPPLRKAKPYKVGSHYLHNHLMQKNPKPAVT